MTPLQVVGIDPGPIPGLVMLRPGPSGLTAPHVVQCTWHTAPAVLRALLGYDDGCPALVQVERFVVGRRASRSTTAVAGEVTRDLIGALTEVVVRAEVPAQIVQRSAATVKPWATDARLEAAGLLEATKGMRHARDAARHALFAACHDGGVPDPLSSRRARP